MKNTIAKVEYNTDCIASTDPDPDIAGIGIIISILLQSFLVISFSIFRWYLELRPSRDTDFVSSTYLFRAPLVFRLRRLSDASYAVSRHTAQIIDDILVMLSDVQGFVACSLIIAALSQVNSISHYHLYMVWNLCICISLSHFASIHFTFRRPQPFYRTRLAIIGIFLCLLTALAVVGKIKFESWDNEEPGLCYRWWTFWPLDQKYWFIIDLIWTSVPYFTFFLPTTTFYKRRVDRHLAKAGRTTPAKVLGIILSLLDGDLGFGVYMLFWFAINLIAVLGVYIPSKDLLVSDGGTGEKEQSQWGFGQVAALCTVPAVFWNAYQIWIEGRERLRGSQMGLQEMGNIPV